MEGIITKEEIKEELKIIARMLYREYKLESLKSTRAIYRAVSELHNKIVDCKLINK